MLKFLRANQRIFLAVFGVFLMITFISSMGKGGGPTQADPEVGHVGSTKFHTSDMLAIKAEVKALRDFGVQGQELDLFERKPEEMALLRYEAKEAGFRAGADQVATAMVHYTGHADDPDARQTAEAAVADYILIQERFGQIQRYAKVPGPAVDQILATDAQHVQFGVVQLSTDQYLSATTRPSEPEIKAQFGKYGSVAPGKPDAANPFGFGYRLPQREQVQYLHYNRLDLEHAVIAKTAYNWWAVPATDPLERLLLACRVVDYYWNSAANDYYRQHKDQFTKAPMPGADPVLQPLADVREHVIRDVRDPLADKLGDDLQQHLTATLTADWTAYQQYLAGGAKGAEPASSVGAAFTSPDYFGLLAKATFKQYLVPVFSGGSSGPVTDDEAEKNAAFGSYEMKQFVVGAAADYQVAVDAKSPTAAAMLFKPSPALSSFSAEMTGPFEGKITTFARLSAFIPAAPPKDPASVADKVEHDLRTVQAYDKAQADAAKLLAMAGNGKLDEAAAAMRTGTTYLDKLPIGLNDALKNPSALAPLQPPLNADASASFFKQAYAPLENYDFKANPHPAVIVQAPDRSRTFVVQVRAVTADWSDPKNGSSFFAHAMMARSELRSLGDQKVSQDWFNFEKTAARLGYVSSKGGA
jgi:hypothetical protein